MSDTQTLRVAIAAGGTAGHINPALALAEELRDRGHEVCFYGQPTRLEARLVPQAGFEFFPIEVTGFDREKPLSIVPALKNMSQATKKLGRHFADVGAPDVAIGFGAYVEMPLLRWCAKHGVPTLIHEQNSVIGLANKTCAKTCACVCVAMPAAAGAFTGHMGSATKLVVTGNPVRRSVTCASREDSRVALGAAESDCVVLVFGGSLGAHHLNEGVVALKEELLSRPGLRIVHSTGADDYDWACQALALTAEEQARWLVAPYIDDMGAKLAAADLVLSRAGASTIAEIAAVCVPSVLVPYPHATADHQTTNARYLTDAGAAEVIRDECVGSDEFRSLFLGLVDNPQRREAMREAARGLGQARAAKALADQVVEVAQGI